jgi:hypothetical protein
MFFINHDLKHVLIDLSSLSSLEKMGEALEVISDQVERFVFLDGDGEEKARRKIWDHLREKTRAKSEFFPKEEDPFSWASFALPDFVAQESSTQLDSVFISESESSVEIAHRYLVGTILFANEVTRSTITSGADQIIDAWTDLALIFSGELLGYLGEADVTPDSIRLRKHSEPKGCTHKVKNDELPDCPIYVGGRYLITSDAGSKRHLYTAHLLAAKKNPDVHGRFFSHVIQSLIKNVLHKESASEYRLTYVPNRPSDEDRMAKLLADLSKTHKVEKLLVCTKDYPKQKSKSSYAEKRENVRGVFKMAEGVDVTEETVLVLDDIGTSFCTMNECARTLLRAGAEKVVLVAIAISAHPSSPTLSQVLCEECGAPRVLRFTKKEGSPFWACSRPTNGGKFHSGLDFPKGFAKLREQDRAVFAPNPEIEF